MTEKQMQRCRDRLEAFLAEMLAPLGRKERLYWGRLYIRGLLLDGERKSIGAMLARLPEGNCQNLQQFVNQSPWPWEPLWRQLAIKLNQAFTTTAWIIDDTGFPKQGAHSVAVHRQYSGTLGKKGNCQVAVSLHQAGPQGSSPLAWRLYLPQVWANDAKRRTKAGVPEEVTFHKKWELALELIDLAIGWGLMPPVILADAGYGEISDFRRGLHKRHLAYAVGVTSQVRVWLEPPMIVVHQKSSTGRPARRRYDYPQQKPLTVREAAVASQQRFRKVSWREGSKGKMSSQFLGLRVQPAHGYIEGEEPGKPVWLLIEWPEDEPQPAKYYLCDLPGDLSLKRLVDIVRGRWRVEQDYQQMKEELGLDHFEGRSWMGWHHHVSLVMLAHSFLRFEQKRRGRQERWTLPQTRREIQRLLCTWAGACCFCGAKTDWSFARSP